MDDGVTRYSLRRDFFFLLTYERHSLVSGTQNDIIVELSCEG